MTIILESSVSAPFDEGVIYPIISDQTWLACVVDHF
jgi:hypothetical protein